MIKTHELKTWPEYFQPIKDGKKLFEYRYNDRGFKSGDRLLLKEYAPQTGSYTGRILLAEVTYVLTDDFKNLPEGYCIMSIKKISCGKWLTVERIAFFLSLGFAFCSKNALKKVYDNEYLAGQKFSIAVSNNRLVYSGLGPWPEEAAADNQKIKEIVGEL